MFKTRLWAATRPSQRVGFCLNSSRQLGVTWAGCSDRGEGDPRVWRAQSEVHAVHVFAPLVEHGLADVARRQVEGAAPHDHAQVDTKKKVDRRFGGQRVLVCVPLSCQPCRASPLQFVMLSCPMQLPLRNPADVRGRVPEPHPRAAEEAGRQVCRTGRLPHLPPHDARRAGHDHGVCLWRGKGYCCDISGGEAVLRPRYATGTTQGRVLGLTRRRGCPVARRWVRWRVATLSTSTQCTGS